MQKEFQIKISTNNKNYVRAKLQQGFGVQQLIIGSLQEIEMKGQKDLI